MKKISMFALAALLFAVGCGKEDEPEPVSPSAPTQNNAPVLTLTGKAKDTVILGTTYTDPGATASDDVDGNITNKIVVAGTVNTNLVGDYIRTYDVSDAAGNPAIQKERMVHVRNEADFLAGNYAVVPNCGSTPASNYNTSIAVSNTTNRIFTVSNLQYNNTGSALNGTLQTGNTIMISAAPGNNATFGASGSIPSAGKINLSSTIGQTSTSSFYFCTSILTKQ